MICTLHLGDTQGSTLSVPVRHWVSPLWLGASALWFTQHLLSRGGGVTQPDGPDTNTKGQGDREKSHVPQEDHYIVHQDIRQCAEEATEQQTGRVWFKKKKEKRKKKRKRIIRRVLSYVVSPTWGPCPPLPF